MGESRDRPAPIFELLASSSDLPIFRSTFTFRAVHLLFLNQYAPPDPAPTSRLLGDVADYLRARGHTVAVVSQLQSYREHPSATGSRLKRELTALFSIFRAAMRSEPRPDAVIALSSPPLLLVVAALVALFRRAALVHWAMDLYPELALALNEIKPGLVATVTQRAMAWAYRRCALIVVLDPDMRDHLRTAYGVRSEVVRLWPSRELHIPATVDLSARWRWMYSGNLGRAHDWETLLDAQRLLEERSLPVHLAFQGRGSVRKAAEARAQELGLRGVDWLDYAAEEDLVGSLLEGKVLIATQRGEAAGFLWPSKLALLLLLPRPLLFVGPPEGAIARDVRSASARNAVFASGDARGVADWIERQFRSSTSEAWDAQAAASLGAAIRRGHDEGCENWARWLADVARTGTRTSRIDDAR